MPRHCPSRALRLARCGVPIPVPPESEPDEHAKRNCQPADEQEAGYPEKDRQEGDLEEFPGMQDVILQIRTDAEECPRKNVAENNSTHHREDHTSP